MKYLTSAAIAAFLAVAGTAAYAENQNLDVIGGMEYAFEAETFETYVGVEYTYESFVVTPIVVINDTSGDFEFDYMELTVAYTFNDNVSAFVRVDTDENFDYNDAYIGVDLRF